MQNMYLIEKHNLAFLNRFLPLELFMRGFLRNLNTCYAHDYKVQLI